MIGRYFTWAHRAGRVCIGIVLVCTYYDICMRVSNIYIFIGLSLPDIIHRSVPNVGFYLLYYS